MIKTSCAKSLFFSLVISTSAIATDGSYKECHSIAKQIEKIDTQRKRGGSGKQMDAWRKKRHQLSNKAYSLRCRKHGIIR